MSINSVVLAGNVTKDPDVKESASGFAIMKFGIAVNERVKRNDEWVNEPNFFECAMFGSRAKSVSRFITKGSKICVSGKLSYSQWEDRDTGKKRSKVEVIVDDLEFMSKHESNDYCASDDIPF